MVAMDKKELITLGIIFAMFVTAFLLVQGMPDKIPTHWNAQGDIDGYGSRETIFLMPIVALGVYVMFLVIPKIAVKKKNVLEFYGKHGFSFKLAMVLFFAAMHAIITWSALENPVDMKLTMPFLIGGLFVYIGYILPDIKRNYFIGIRTPWALADEKNWQKTHRFGGKLFMLLGIASIAFAVVGMSLMWWVGLTLLAVAAMFYYSYREFKGA